MKSEFIIPIISQVDVIYLAVALISILFFFYYVKVKFQKTASSKSYGILFYAFVFYSIAALSFVLLNAIDRFFRLNHDLYSNFIWFLPVCLLSASFGALIGWLIYFAASKIAEPYAYKMLNLSLLIIAPTLAYTLLIKPYNQTLSLLITPDNSKLERKQNNTLEYTVLKDKPSVIFSPATPASFHDTLDIQVISGKVIQIISKQNGFIYTHRLATGIIQNMYAVDLKNRNYLAILALSAPLDMQATLLIFNKLGDCVFKERYDDYPNRMSSSLDGKFLLLQKEITPDSLVFKTCFKL
ncbi:MAG: hypothetical protein Q8M15_08110 [Bacteroidota bacterium]|nr:hypothetical protein [Bacteroidota bacterium]